MPSTRLCRATFISPVSSKSQCYDVHDRTGVDKNCKVLVASVILYRYNARRSKSLKSFLLASLNLTQMLPQS